MSIAADLTAREAEIIRILKALGPQLGRFVVVGGYAVNALTSHRFSVDCDMVIPEKDAKLFEDVLEKEGYARQRPTRQLKGIYGAKTQQYMKAVGDRKVSVDLLVNSLLCRQTGGEWSYELIRRNSFEANVVGVTDSATAFVPARELLMAMKIHSGRDTDMRDVIMLSEGADWHTVAEFVKCGEQAKVHRQITSAIETMSAKRFPSALRAQFGLRTDVTQLINRTIEGLNVIKELLSASL
ncbi:MAG: hypothetical protein HYU39_05480 [Thaumarchaeota archaeon]|nr:hypothetical protein [Nitrososphaerota archaeon]